MVLWLLFVCAILVTFVTTFGRKWYDRNCRKTTGRCHCTTQLHGKTVFITGATAGLGRETAYALAARGARVILACRNLNKARKVAEDIVRKTANPNVFIRLLDVADFDSIRRFAKDFLADGSHLHILINNAGIGSQKLWRSPQGLELTMATNHFGPFLLTNLLLDTMKKSAPSRVINVSSIGHTCCKQLPWDDLGGFQATHSGWATYSRSKLCNILFTKQLAERLKDTGVTANSLHPGVVSTEIFGKVDNWLFKSFIAPLVSWFGKTSVEGIQTIIHLALSEELATVSGKYFSDCKESKCSRLARNPEAAKKLWDLSERIVGLSEETSLA
ncbi:Retinol dehydrogenase 12 [Halocaridina rubra]|uniref:Retinol dehydrogenase 12 n=1 Tax=Halocaridina rubra TaxID=373956 RepID=A0AAN8WRN8_HALRR